MITKNQRNFRFKNVDIWYSDSVLRNQDVVIQDGVVQSIGSSKTGDASGLVLIPAGVDVQVHLRVPGQEHKESPETGLLAAVCGGYGAVLTMPNTHPVIDCAEVVEMTRKILSPLEEKYGVRVEISAAVTRTQLGEEVVDFESLARAGVKAFTDDGRGVKRDEMMAKSFECLQEIGLPLLQHSEFPDHGGVLAPGPVQKKLGLSPYFPEPEIEMLKRDLDCLNKFPKARYHLLHTTSRLALPLVKEAKENGFQVTAEVSPHHLYFCSDDIQQDNTSFKMNPPLRGAEDRQALQEGLQSGVLDWVATDHAPHSSADKTNDFRKAAFGTLGLETSLRVLVDLLQAKRLSSERLVQVFSTRPADFLRLPEEEGWGKIQSGRTFRAVLIDPKAEKQPYKESEIHSKSHNTCFLGTPLPNALIAHHTENRSYIFQAEKLEGIYFE